MSINKIHVNNSTKISLNDRFTVIQSVRPKTPPSSRKIGRRRTHSASFDDTTPNTSLANRKLVEQLEKKHKIQAALKLKRRSLKAQLPPRQRIRNRIGLKKGTINAIRLAPNGKLTRSNSLSNIATMKADLVESTLKRSNSTSNIIARLGTRRNATNTGKAGLPRRRINRNNFGSRSRTPSKQNLSRSRSRSNSMSNLKRSISKSNLRRSNSKIDLSRRGSTLSENGGGMSPIKRINRNRRFDSSNNARNKGSASINNRLGLTRSRSRSMNRGNPARRRRLSQGGVARGRITRRGNSTGNLLNGGAQQGRMSRPRGRGIGLSQRGRSQSRNRLRNRSLQRDGSVSRRGGGATRGRNRGRTGRSRGIGRSLGLYNINWNNKKIKQQSAKKQEIRKEDLDNELDQYMANTKTALDKEMDVFMSN